MRRGQKSPILLLKSMITQPVVEQIIHEKIEGTRIFLVDVMIGSGNSILVHVDTHKGISIDECVELSRYITGRLDKDTEDYQLEVSSPGLDASFKVSQQYEKNLQKQVEVIKNDGTKICVKLLAFSENEIIVEQMVKPKAPAKSKKPVAEQLTMALEDIKTIKSVISFK